MLTERSLVRGSFALATIITLYLIWPYVVLFLAIVGAFQIYRVWRHHRH